MASLKVYLDNRSLNKQGEAPLKISISHRGTSALLSLGLYLKPSDWDKDKAKVINHPRRNLLNSLLAKRLSDMQSYILTNSLQGISIGSTAKEVKQRLEAQFSADSAGDGSQELNQEPTYTEYFEQVMERKIGKTQSTYRHTLGRLRAFDSEIDGRSFEDINKAWLERFGLWCASEGVSLNTLSIHYRNMRTVFNDAIDNEVSTAYPFRRFKIKTARTAKRSLSVEQLRLLFSARVDEVERQYLDMFKLIFYLRGINMIDLLHLRGINEEGRIEFNRAKTKRFYSMKVEPEALAIIERYRGTKYLLSVMERYQNSDNFLKRTNKALKRLGATEVGKQGRKTFKPLFPEISTYWARHTWATIAASLDIPKETIAQALGHGGNSVTDIYIDFDQTKVDEANRKVIDYVLGLKPE